MLSTLDPADELCETCYYGNCCKRWPIVLANCALIFVAQDHLYLLIAWNFPEPSSKMNDAEAMRTKNDILKAQPFLLDIKAVNSIGQCSKSCYLAIGWLLDNAAAKSPVNTMVLKQTMTDGGSRSFAVERTADSGKYFPWEV